MSEKKPDAPKKGEKKPAVKKDAWCMYIGPTIRGVIHASQIFPKSAAEVRESFGGKLPENAAPLIVDGEHLPTARQEIKVEGSALRHYYESLKRR